MNWVYKRLLMLTVAVGLSFFSSASFADAAFVMTIADSDGNSYTVNDNNIPPGTALDLDPASGQIIFSGTLGAFNIQISVGTSNAPGTPSLAQLTINNTSISSAGFTGNKTVTISLQDTGFTAPTGSNLNLESQLSVTNLPLGSDVTYQSFLNGVGGTILSLPNTNPAGIRVSDPVNITSTPFTLASVTTYTVKGQGTGTTLTVQTTGLTAIAVPAPAGVTLVLIGLPVLGLGAWFRRRRAAGESAQPV